MDKVSKRNKLKDKLSKAMGELCVWYADNIPAKVRKPSNWDRFNDQD